MRRLSCVRHLKDGFPGRVLELRDLDVGEVHGMLGVPMQWVHPEWNTESEGSVLAQH